MNYHSLSNHELRTEAEDFGNADAALVLAERIEQSTDRITPNRWGSGASDSFLEDHQLIHYQ